jgi:hypothetical protein
MLKLTRAVPPASTFTACDIVAPLSGLQLTRAVPAGTVADTGVGP